MDNLITNNWIPLLGIEPAGGAVLEHPDEAALFVQVMCGQARFQRSSCAIDDDVIETFIDERLKTASTSSALPHGIKLASSSVSTSSPRALPSQTNQLAAAAPLAGRLRPLVRNTFMLCSQHARAPTAGPLGVLCD